MEKSDLPSEHDLHKLLSQEQFLKAIINQLNKDLGSLYDDIVIKVPENVANDLKQQLCDHISSLDKLPGNRVQDLMYRVDVSQNVFMDAMSLDNKENQCQTLAEIILNREMQKVWFRLNYQP
jgi:hypothetical protein